MRSKPELPADSPKTPVFRKGREHIRSLEDEPALARLDEIALTKSEYPVTTCTDSYEALQIFQAHPDRVDSVFTDPAMPNLTGAQLSQELLRMPPNLPIILATGYRKKPVKFGVLTQTIRKFSKGGTDETDSGH